MTRWPGLLLGILLPISAAAQSAGWPVELWDPGAQKSAPADLVLPMPCGGSMAFQKVPVPLEATDPLADRRIRLGQSLGRTGYSDYLRSTYLRGAFEDADGGSHYYIARYELTQGQFRALQADCTARGRADRIARGGFSWHDAVTLAQNYTAWLYRNAPAALPQADGAPGFLRLPTETEWEYAVRGGASADPVQFADLRFFADGTLRDYAQYQGGGARGRLGPVGSRGANPLGLFDVYGNAEELMLEPYRLNVSGRAHGQVGGVVTRGGSVLSTAPEIYSAQRTEYPPHDARTGRPLRGDTFGVRLVISAHVSTSDARLAEISRRWQSLSPSAEGTRDPDAILTDMIRAEPDPARQDALSALQLELRRNREQTSTALSQSARATLLSGAVFMAAIGEGQGAVDAKAASIRLLVELQRAGGQSAILDRQLQTHVQEIEDMRRQQGLYLLSYRTALDTLTSDYSEEERQAAVQLLREELEMSGQVGLALSLGRFLQDMTRYAAAPDLSKEALLDLALE